MDREQRRGRLHILFQHSVPFCRKENEDSESEVLPVTIADKINKLKILIVEDDETSEMLIRLAVRNFSDNILTAATGVEAIKQCQNNPDIDLILMDIKMGEMDGYEATRQIRLWNKKVKIIAQTAFGMEGDREKAIDAGCNDYISKPLDIAILKELIKGHFS
jgi:CheY-like chemotaxis protein